MSKATLRRIQAKCFDEAAAAYGNLRRMNYWMSRGKKGNFGALTDIAKDVMKFGLMVIIGFIMMGTLAGLTIVSTDGNASAAIASIRTLLNTVLSNGTTILGVLIVAIVAFILYRTFFQGGGVFGGRN